MAHSRKDFQTMLAQRLSMLTICYSQSVTVTHSLSIDIKRAAPEEIGNHGSVVHSLSIESRHHSSISVQSRKKLEITAAQRPSEDLGPRRREAAGQQLAAGPEREREHRQGGLRRLLAHAVPDPAAAHPESAALRDAQDPGRRPVRSPGRPRR